MLKDYLIIDTETTGLRPYQDRVVATGLYPAPDRGAAVSIIDGRRAALWGTHKYYVGHNIRFDMHFQRLETGPTHLIDTEVLARLAWPNEKSYKLKDLMKAKFGEPCTEDTEIKRWLGEEKRRRKKAGEPEPNYGDAPKEMLHRYLRQDLLYTDRLFRTLWPMVEDHPYLDTEIRLTRAIYEMEKKGWDISQAALLFLIQEMRGGIMRETEQLVLETGKVDFNLDSPRQVGEYLKTLGLVSGSRTATGQMAVDKGALKGFKHPWADGLLRYREMSKKLNTYYEPILGMLDGDHRLHPSFRQIGAITGRMSCADPNMQNIGSKDPLRKCFFVKDKELLFADFSQIEIRLLAHYADDKKLQEHLKAGGDIHQRTADELLPQGVTEARKIAKTLNFAVIYGAGAGRILEQLRETGIHLMFSDVQALLRRHDAIYPGIKKFCRETIRFIEQGGTVRDIWGREYDVPKDEAYKAINYLIQGTASQVMKQAFVRLHDEGFDIRNVIHDEFIIACDKARKEVPKVRAYAEDRTTFKVPLTVDFKWSPRSWGEKEGL